MQENTKAKFNPTVQASQDPGKRKGGAQAKGTYTA